MRIRRLLYMRHVALNDTSGIAEATTAYLTERNENPKPYQWKAKGEELLAKIHRARQTLEREGG
ncbi:MAG: hypothetical protein OXC19_24490 [Bryobacterales bacterium]|nr:hypothetical protein [Bryobacterales bacterium]